MTVKRFGTFVALFLFIVGLATGATYLFLDRIQPCGCQPVQPGTHISRLLAHELGLSPEQKKKLEPMEAQLSKDLKKIQLELTQKRISLTRLLKEESTQPKDLNRHIKQVSEIETRQHGLIVGYLMAVRGILTPEQRDKFFSAITSDICHACRSITGHSKCLCGRCSLGKEGLK